jgi:hypothetical protein
MELIDLIKKLRAIKADSGYTRESRAFILSKGRDKNAEIMLFARETISGIFRSGWAIALTAALFLLAISSFSALRILHPVTNAVVDVTGLKAEAQAIDAQIQLNNVEYDATAGIENKTSTISAAPKAATAPAKKETAAENTGVAASTSTPPTIDSVLDALSQ